MIKRHLLCASALVLAACGLTVSFGQVFNLKYGASATVKDTALKVTFQHVIDNRCVIGPGCADGGSADVRLNVVDGDAVRVLDITIPGAASAQAKTQDSAYEYTVGNLQPQAQSGVTIPVKDYALDVKIEKLATLTGFYWQLDSMGYTDSEATRVLGGTSYLLSFDGANLVKGKKACNKMSGQYSASGTSIGFSGIDSTLNDCEHVDQETLDNQIAFFENGLNGATSYQVSSSTLKITSSDSRELNFNGIMKNENCNIPAGLSTDNVQQCYLDCVVQTPVNMSCPNVDSQCRLHCSVN